VNSRCSSWELSRSRSRSDCVVFTQSSGVLTLGCFNAAPDVPTRGSASSLLPPPRPPPRRSISRVVKDEYHRGILLNTLSLEKTISTSDLVSGWVVRWQETKIGDIKTTAR
jgi:hypothetical protein